MDILESGLAALHTDWRVAVIEELYQRCMKPVPNAENCIELLGTSCAVAFHTVRLNGLYKRADNHNMLRACNEKLSYEMLLRPFSYGHFDNPQYAFVLMLLSLGTTFGACVPFESQEEERFLMRPLVEVVQQFTELNDAEEIMRLDLAMLERKLRLICAALLDITSSYDGILTPGKWAPPAELVKQCSPSATISSDFGSHYQEFVSEHLPVDLRLPRSSANQNNKVYHIRLINGTVHLLNQWKQLSEHLQPPAAIVIATHIAIRSTAWNSIQEWQLHDSVPNGFDESEAVSTFAAEVSKSPALWHKVAGPGFHPHQDDDDAAEDDIDEDDIINNPNMERIGNTTFDVKQIIGIIMQSYEDSMRRFVHDFVHHTSLLLTMCSEIPNPSSPCVASLSIKATLENLHACKSTGPLQTLMYNWINIFGRIVYDVQAIHAEMTAMQECIDAIAKGDLLEIDGVQYDPIAMMRDTYSQYIKVMKDPAAVFSQIKSLLPEMIAPLNISDKVQFVVEQSKYDTASASSILQVIEDCGDGKTADAVRSACLACLSDTNGGFKKLIALLECILRSVIPTIKYYRYLNCNILSNFEAAVREHSSAIWNVSLLHGVMSNLAMNLASQSGNTSLISDTIILMECVCGPGMMGTVDEAEADNVQNMGQKVYSNTISKLAPYASDPSDTLFVMNLLDPNFGKEEGALADEDTTNALF